MRNILILSATIGDYLPTFFLTMYFQNKSRFIHSFIFFALSLFLSAYSTAATTDDEKAQTVVHMLDYISVDYPEFVQNGKVLNQSEFEEQLEFSTQALTLLKEMPTNAEQASLLDKGQALRKALSLIHI